MTEIRKDAEKTVKLSDLPNQMIKAIASQMLKHQNVYYCTLSGVKIAVIK